MARSLGGWLTGQGWRNRTQRMGASERNYQPKQCRTAGCTQSYLHDGRCTGRNRQALTVRIPSGAGNREGRRAARRSERLGEFHDRLHHPRRRGQTDPLVRENMSRIRNHQPTIVRVSR